MTLHQRVESILRHVPASRSNDRLLCVLYMQKSGVGLTEAQIKAFYAMDDLWSIRRCRQKIQEEGKYPATPDVDKARFEKFKQVKQEIVHNIPQQWL